MKQTYPKNRPLMFYQGAKDDRTLAGGARIRIFYPDGTAEWTPLHPASFSDVEEKYNFKQRPCWLLPNADGELSPGNLEEALERARNYDQRAGFPEMEYLGAL